jgi:predicted aspartyl protease
LGLFPHAFLLAGNLMQAAVAANADPAALQPVVTGRTPDAATESAVSTLFATPTTRDHIGRVVVPVMLNGRGPFRFVVDTGANHSTISPRLVEVLGLKPADATIMVNGITGAAPALFVTVDSLRAGALAVEGLDLPVVWTSVMAGADGILGAAGLKEKSLLIDFQRNRVEIGRYLKLDERSQGIKVHALPPTHGLITVEAKVGKVPVIAILDTGSERTLGNLALRDALRKPETRGLKTRLTSVYGATAEVELGEMGAAPPISIESVRITEVSIVYGDFHVFKVWELTDMPAIILGMDVLGTVASLSIDFKNQNVYISSASQSEVRFGMRSTGGEGMQRR